MQGNEPFHLGFNISGSAYDQKKNLLVVCCRFIQN